MYSSIENFCYGHQLESAFCILRKYDFSKEFYKAIVADLQSHSIVKILSNGDKFFYFKMTGLGNESSILKTKNVTELTLKAIDSIDLFFD